MKFIFAIMSLMIFSNLSYADCLSLQNDAQTFYSYRTDYLKFEAEYDTLSDSDRFIIMEHALDKNIRMLKKTSEDSQIPLDMWTDMKFILDFSFGLQNANERRMTIANLNTMDSLQHMRNGLLQFRLAIEHKLEAAQINFPDCEIVERK
jgi:hypothetical protein